MTPPKWTAIHPDLHPLCALIFWTDGDPAVYLQDWLDRLIVRDPMPRDGWRLSVDNLSCPCGETNLPGRKAPVEIVQTHRGPMLVCATCGRAAPLKGLANVRSAP